MAGMPKCDCLNECGDDPWIKDGKVEVCDYWKQQQALAQQREDDKKLLGRYSGGLKDKRVAAALDRLLRELR